MPRVVALDVARDVDATRRAVILETLRTRARDGADATTREIASDDDAATLERRVVRRVPRARARRARRGARVRARERKTARGGRAGGRRRRRGDGDGDGGGDGARGIHDGRRARATRVVRCVKPNWARGTAFALKSRAVRVNATEADAADAWRASGDGGRRRAHRRERVAHGAGRERDAGEVRRLRRRGGEEGV